MKLISGTQAAKILGVGNNLTFVKKFVNTGQISAVQYPGSKRKLYVISEVENLIELNKRRKISIDNKLATKLVDKIIFNNRIRSASC